MWGLRIDPGNFQRKLRACTDFVAPTDRTTIPPGGRGRPARLFRPVGDPLAPLTSPIARSAM
ncbi:MAG: hypothetical protein FWH11_08525 [Micrococcales bacterium]|nr:hypothetical protein [Micrococcales bacterium]